MIAVAALEQARKPRRPFPHGLAAIPIRGIGEARCSLTMRRGVADRRACRAAARRCLPEADSGGASRPRPAASIAGTLAAPWPRKRHGLRTERSIHHLKVCSVRTMHNGRCPSRRHAGADRPRGAARGSRPRRRSHHRTASCRPTQRARMTIRARQPGVVAGLDLARLDLRACSTRRSTLDIAAPDGSGAGRPGDLVGTSGRAGTRPAHRRAHRAQLSSAT